MMQYAGLVKSSRWMLFYWTGCAVMGLVYWLGLWDGAGSPAFIVGQIAMGIIGMAHEIYIQRTYGDRG